MNLRTIAESASRRIVLKRRLPSAFGRAPLYVAPSIGGLRYWRRNTATIDPILLRTAERLIEPGSKVWDIGANLGLFTFAAAVRAGKNGYVLAVEPDAEAASLLLRNRRANKGKQTAAIEILVAAVNDRNEDRIATLDIAVRARAANALRGFGSTQTGGILESRTVPVFRLDDLKGFFPVPSIIKVDVEGAESIVLAGGSRLLEEIRPTLIVEVSSQCQRSVGRILNGFEYRVFDAGRQDWPEVTLPPWDTIAIPVETCDQVLERTSKPLPRE
jgi:FkbM family methyltransferase